MPITRRNLFANVPATALSATYSGSKIGMILLCRAENEIMMAMKLWSKISGIRKRHYYVNSRKHARRDVIRTHNSRLDVVAVTLWLNDLREKNDKCHHRIVLVENVKFKWQLCVDLHGQLNPESLVQTNSSKLA